MDKKRRWRSIFVWGLLVFSILYCVPTIIGGEQLPDGYKSVFDKELGFGLDLAGGLELRYRVSWKDAIEQNGRKLGDSIRRSVVEAMAKDANENAADLDAKKWDEYAAKVKVEIPEYQTIEVTVPADQAVVLSDEFLEQLDNRYEVYKPEDNVFRLTLEDEHVQTIRDSVLKETQKTIRRRVEAFGLVDPDVRIAGDADIVVQIPGVGAAQMDMVRKRIGQTAQLTIRMVDETNNYFAGKQAAVDAFKAAPDARGRYDSLQLVPRAATGPFVRAEKKSELIAFINSLQDVPTDRIFGYGEEYDRDDDGNPTDHYWMSYMLYAKVDLTGDHLSRAQVFFDEQQRPYVSLDLNAEGGRIFGDLTEKNVDRYTAIMLDDVVASAPRINEKIPGGRVKITMGGGSSTQAQLNDSRSLTKVLNQGAYQAPVFKVHDHEVGPSLGAASVEAGTLAMGVGLLLVIIFMMITYARAGLIAVAVLSFNMLLILMLLVSFNSALTLPGIAGIILTIGMAVDANIIIFERIREELASGRSPRAAVDAGYAKAMSTILDANITTALAGVILLNYTSGTIRGFAVTLLMGIVCSVFTAVWVSRLIFNWYLTSKKPQTLSI